jgi:hypothetical protein
MMPSAPVELKSLAMGASRAFKAVGPSRAHQRRLALFLGPVFLHELRQRKTFLKLNPVDSHDASPVS